MLHFEWSKKRTAVALDLAEGYSIDEVCKRNTVSRMSIHRWKCNSEFNAEVDRLTLMTGIAVKAERLKIVKKVARQQMKEELNKTTGENEVIVTTRKDLLEWLQFAQSETDGVKLDLTQLLAAFTKDAGALAGSRPGGIPGDDAGQEPESD